MSEGGLAQAALLEGVAEMLTVLANVVAGDYDARLDASFHPSGSDLRRLYDGINTMIASLTVERQRGESYEAELEEKLSLIDAQRTAIADLSTPVLEVMDGVVCLPILGFVDRERTEVMMESLLETIVSRRARCAIVDLTAAHDVTATDAATLLALLRSIRLIGVDAYVCGIGPRLAKRIVELDLEGSASLQTYTTLRNALVAFALRDRRLA